MSDVEKRLFERSPDFEARHEAAMRQGYMARRYRAAYFGVGMFVVIAALWVLRLLGLF